MSMRPLLALCVACAVFRSDVSAQTWERLGPQGGSVVSLGADPHGGVYLGTADGHVFFSGDGAQSWELRGRVGNRLDAVVTSLVSDPEHVNRVFAAAWYQGAGGGGGVFQSEDGGRSWALLGLASEAVRALEIAPSRPDTLVAGTRTGVFRSEDAGKTWERISPAGDEELRNVDSVAIDPGNPALIYVGTYHLPWKTGDSGKTWKPVAAGIIDDSDVMSMRIDATNPSRLFLSACSGIYRSEDQGADWTKLQGIPYSARRTQAIAQDPGNPKTLFAGTTEGLWVTRDAGENWARTTPKEWVVNSVVVIPGPTGREERVVLGREGRGIQVSDDSGVHFAEANRGFTHVIVKELIADPARAGHFLMLVERPGERIMESPNSGVNWVPVGLTAPIHGEGSQLLPEQIMQAFGSPWGWLVRTADGQFWLRDEEKRVWKKWNLRTLVRVRDRTAKAGQAMTRSVELKPATQIVFAGDAALVATSSGLFRCGSAGSCSSLNAYVRGEEIRALWASQSSPEIAVVQGEKLGLSGNGGESAIWSQLPVGNEDVLWLDIADSAETQTAQTVFLGTKRGLYVSQNGTSSWVHLAGGLPQASVVRWLRDTKLWVVAERNGGLYVSRDQGATWERMDRDAEGGQFSSLVWMAPGVLLAGSQSEGLLRLELPPGTLAK